jgi:hypothetical protein
MTTKLDCDEAGNDDRPHLLGFRGREPKLSADALHLPVNGDPSLLEVETVRGHPQHFPDAQPGDPKRDRSPKPEGAASRRCRTLSRVGA